MVNKMDEKIIAEKNTLSKYMPFNKYGLIIFFKNV